MVERRLNASWLSHIPAIGAHVFGHMFAMHPPAVDLLDVVSPSATLHSWVGSLTCVCVAFSRRCSCMLYIASASRHTHTHLTTCRHAPSDAYPNGTSWTCETPS